MADSELINVLGKNVDSPEVRAVIEKYDLTEIQDDPPSRRYYISRQNGLDLVTEDDRVVDIQIFLQPTKRFSEFGGPLPFGIQKGMSQAKVHELLGQPVEADRFDSKYEIAGAGAAVLITYDDSSIVKYISVGEPV